MSQSYNVLKPVYHRLGAPGSRPHPDDLHRVIWKCVGQATGSNELEAMEDAKRLLCRPVLELANPAYSRA